MGHTSPTSSSSHITVTINIFLSPHLQHLTHITFTIYIVIHHFHHSFLPPTTSPSSSSIINISVTFNIVIYHSFLSQFPLSTHITTPLTLLFPPSPPMLPLLFITSVAPLRAASNSVCL